VGASDSSDSPEFVAGKQGALVVREGIHQSGLFSNWVGARLHHRSPVSEFRTFLLLLRANVRFRREQSPGRVSTEMPLTSSRTTVHRAPQRAEPPGQSADIPGIWLRLLLGVENYETLNFMQKHWFWPVKSVLHHTSHISIEIFRLSKSQRNNKIQCKYYRSCLCG